MNRGKERITLEMSILDIIRVMSEGNPGAVTVLMQIIKHNPNIDPMDWCGPIGPILGLDTLGVYGSRIWMLYKDFCKQNLVDMLVMLRCHQMGFINSEELNAAIDNYGNGVDIEEMKKKLREKLPRFNYAYKVE